MISQIDNESVDEASEKISTAKQIAHRSVTVDDNWESFNYYFEQIHPSSIVDFKNVFPLITQNNLRSLSYLKIGLTDKELAHISGITKASFQKFKYRLNKKLGENADSSRQKFLDEF